MARCIRAVGNLDALEAVLACSLNNGAATATQTVSAGIGHTRWATHGGVTEVNAHPHEDASGRFRIVLNGIIENHRELRDRLARDLVRLRSDTDAEVVAHLIALNYDGSLSEAVRRSLDELDGHYAIVAMCEDEPDTLVGVRRECPLVVGLGEGEQFIASSISAFLAHTREVAALRDGEIAVLRPDEVEVFDVSGHPDGRARCTSTGTRNSREGRLRDVDVEEIHEQVAAVRETLASGAPTCARN